MKIKITIKPKDDLSKEDIKRYFQKVCTDAFQNKAIIEVEEEDE